MEEMNEKVKEVEKGKANEEEEDKDKEYEVSVMGFDDSASELDIQIKMCEHLYSCGEVTEVRVCGSGRINSVWLVASSSSNMLNSQRLLILCGDFDFYNFSSACRFGLYETDFRLGKTGLGRVSFV